MLSSSHILVTMILLPLLGSFLNGIVIRPAFAKRAGVIATFFAASSFACAVFLFFSLSHDVKAINWSTNWFTVGEFHQQWGFKFDALTAVMALVVTGIGSLIHLYSIGYMAEERGPSRYFAYLNLFLFNMLVLIASDNLLGLFVGWEGVGLCSYLLIGYWYEDIDKAKAGMKAFLVNRIGDAGFLIGMFYCYQIFHTIRFDEIAQLLATSSQFDLHLLNIVAFFLFVGASGKSAQIPLYVWLPDAMAGPTPVSALIHAATMVTAGVYLICRMNFLYMLTADANVLIAWIGAGTALFAALIAMAQSDIKKVLAYSTVSQLGLMFLAVGSRAYFAAVFHLMTHAFFKALLFLGAGSVIHGLHGEQNIFNMGGLRKKMPGTFLTCLIATAAICGIPPLSGFFSKDTILFSALASGSTQSSLLWGVALVASTLTAFYMTRMFVLVFLGNYRGEAHPHESPWVMMLPLLILAVGSALTGFLGVPHGLHFMPNLMGHYLASVLVEFPEQATLISEHAAMFVATGLALFGISVGWFFYSRPSRAESAYKVLKPMHLIFSNKFWIDELYGIVFLAPFKAISSFFSSFVDPTVIDGLALLPVRISSGVSVIINVIQSGLVQFYLMILLLGGLWVLWSSLKGWVI
ncbi:MAG: NADH-quinone oxidoreductase subunit L [Deltaproteobacteria bacterium]|nr:NADH-quinone oxidoreductase subunit L [Deltaproteobacteria bacterium]